VIAGWGLAQQPQFLPGLTIEQAAAGRSSIIALLVALGLGTLVLAPSLAFLFTLVLRGRFDPGAVPEQPSADVTQAASTPRERLLPAALAVFAVSALIMLALDSPLARVLGVTGLLTSVAAGFVALAGLVTSTDAETPEADNPRLG
jgi:cytochrome d ubiquinol oxidase subunit II